MSTQERIQKYRKEGGAADLVRVEVLVPPQAREEILAAAVRLRDRHRNDKRLRALYDEALAKYRVRVRDNVDLDRLPEFEAKATVVAHALMERGNAHAFRLGREILAQIGAIRGAH
ncbi:MAG TPA: hypothetical protein VFB45_27090 [Pseudolabrys sp.]|nr:hypothetical protein [Pseudolabrys sp.]